LPTPEQVGGGHGPRNRDQTTAKPDRLDPERSDATDAMTSPNAETLISRRRFIHRDDGYSSVDVEVWRWVLAYALALPTG
jgi:hypothetical protein